MYHDVSRVPHQDLQYFGESSWCVQSQHELQLKVGEGYFYYFSEKLIGLLFVFEAY